jgi:hypothetical protein
MVGDCLDMAYADADHRRANSLEFRSLITWMSIRFRGRSTLHKIHGRVAVRRALGETIWSQSALMTETNAKFKRFLA